MASGIQGHDTIPNEITKLFGKLFTDYLPGWSKDGIYNFQAAAETQIGAAQLGKLMHNGSHSWINNAMKELLKDFNGSPEIIKINGVDVTVTPTQRMAALVNFMKEAASDDALASGGAKN